MIRSAVTVSLVPEARGGPFVFWDDLSEACRKAADLGFDAVEVFPPDAGAVREAGLADLLTRHNLKLAAMGTGGGWVAHRLTLTSGERSVREQAINFVRSIIDAAGPMGAPAIIGSMQGRWDGSVSRASAMSSLAEALRELADHARQYGVPVVYEPLNRYETNMANTVEAGIVAINSSGSANVKLLADLFHMNVEEADIAGAIRGGKGYIGHVHWADSNRRPAGAGHTDFVPVAAALTEIGYDGYVSAEVLPYPDPDAAAKLTIDSVRRHFPRG